MINKAGNRRGLRHGLSTLPEYQVWKAIKQRCTNPNNKAFKHYGERGIEMCSEWQDDFEAFLRDMGPRTSPDHSVERADNDGPYSKDNCPWQPAAVQARNQRSNVNITIDGVTKCLQDWSLEYGVHATTITNRLAAGVDPKEAVSRPANSITLTLNGETKSCGEWCRILDLNPQTVTHRKKMGWTDEDCLLKPSRKAKATTH